MKVKDLEGNIVNWKLSGDIVTASDNKKRSGLHQKARVILYELFPTSQILEEVPVKLRRGSTQYFDFYINQIRLVIEVHGIQHYKFNSLFHSGAHDFINQKKRDREKIDWCEINNITYIELPYNESIEQWKNRIIKR